jgi:hypothetical protein
VDSIETGTVTGARAGVVPVVAFCGALFPLGSGMEGGVFGGGSATCATEAGDIAGSARPFELDMIV